MMQWLSRWLHESTGSSVFFHPLHSRRPDEQVLKMLIKRGKSIEDRTETRSIQTILLHLAPDNTHYIIWEKIGWPAQIAIMSFLWQYTNTEYLQCVHTVSEVRRSCLWALPGPCWSPTACSVSLCCGRSSARWALSHVSLLTLVRELWGDKREDSWELSHRLDWRPVQNILQLPLNDNCHRLQQQKQNSHLFTVVE